MTSMSSEAWENVHYGNKITFSANGLGILLKTRYGYLNFTTEEFTLYELLFRIADSGDQGELAVGGLQLNTLLLRTNTAWEVLAKALLVVKAEQNDGTVGGPIELERKAKESISRKGGSKGTKKRNAGAAGTDSSSAAAQAAPDSVNGTVLNFHQWLMFCKLIAFCQTTKRDPTEKVFQSLHAQIALEDDRLEPRLPSSAPPCGVQGGTSPGQHRDRLPAACFHLNLNQPRRKFAAAAQLGGISICNSPPLSGTHHHREPTIHEPSTFVNGTSEYPLSRPSTTSTGKGVSGVASVPDMRYTVTLGGWQLRTDEARHQHVKFSLSTTVYFSSSGATSAAHGSAYRGLNETDVADDSCVTERERGGSWDPGRTGDGINGPSQQARCLTYVTERRYSEFETLAQVLQRHCRGAIVPPIPPKNFSFNFDPSDSLARQGRERSLELQLFLSDLITHPVLRHSYALQAFLLSSSTGQRAAMELFTQVLDADGRLVQQQRRTRSGGGSVNGTVGGAGAGAVEGTAGGAGVGEGLFGQGLSAAGAAWAGSGMARLLSDSASAMTSGAQQLVEQARSSGYLSALWEGASRAVAPVLALQQPSELPPLPAPVALPADAFRPAGVRGSYAALGEASEAEAPPQQLLLAVARSSQWLGGVSLLGRRTAALLTAELSTTEELSEIGLSCKLMAEFESAPLLRALRLLGGTVDSQVAARRATSELHHFQLLLPVQYVGRYEAGHRHADQLRQLSAQEHQQAVRHEAAASKTLELVRAASASRNVAADPKQQQHRPEEGTAEEQARLDVAAARAARVEAAAEAGRLSRLLCRDGLRLERLGKQQLLACAVNLAKTSLEARRQERLLWEALHRDLLADVSPPLHVQSSANQRN